MKIPNSVLKFFEKEIEETEYGRVSLGVILRGGHCHYEIDKHFTIHDKSANEKEKLIEEKINNKVVVNENNN